MASPVQTFDDDFNTLSLDTGSGGTWQPDVPWAPQGASTGSCWVANPATLPGDANPYSVSGGILSIATKPTPADVNPGSVNSEPFVAGQLTTAKSFSQLYGYFEVSAKMSTMSGSSSAPLWLIPAGGTSELDVAEAVTSNPGQVVQTSHSGANPSSGSQTWTSVPDSTTAFHTYGVDWEADKITWYIDGKQTAQAATPADMHQAMYLLTDTLTGTSSTWEGQPKAGDSGQMQVDYIRAYTSKPDASQAAPAAAPAAPAAAPAASSTDPTVATINTLTLHLSEDAWKGNAQFQVAVDGKALNSPTEVTALHSAGSVQDFAFSVGAGPHDVAVSFLNDAYGGSGSADRNLYVQGIDYAGQHTAGAALFGTSTQHFHVG